MMRKRCAAEQCSCGHDALRLRSCFYAFPWCNFTQAIGRGRDSFLLAVIRQLVFDIPLLFLFNHLFGVQGIVRTQLTADLFTVAVSYLIYFRIRKQEGWPVTI